MKSLGALLKAAIPVTSDITLEDTIKTEIPYTPKTNINGITIQKPINYVNSKLGFDNGIINSISTIQEPINYVNLKPGFENDITNGISAVQEPINHVNLKPSFKDDIKTIQKPAKFISIKEIVENNKTNGVSAVQEPIMQEPVIQQPIKNIFRPSMGDGVIPYTNYDTTNGIEVVQEPMQYINVEPNSGYSVTVNEQKSEDSYSIKTNATFYTKDKVYSMEGNLTLKKGEGYSFHFNTCVRGKVSINAKYVGHSSTEIPAGEKVKEVVQSNDLEVNKLYVEKNEDKSDIEVIIDIYKTSFSQRGTIFNPNLAWIYAGVRSLRYLLNKYCPALGETMDKWKQKKDEFIESSLESIRQFYEENPQFATNAGKMLVGMEIDETELNALEKAQLAEDAFVVGVIKDLASGVNGIVDVVLSPLETVEAVTSPDAEVGEMIWQGLTEDIVNDWEKGTIQGKSQAVGRVASMLIPVAELKAAGTAGKTGKTGAKVLGKIERKSSGKLGSGVEISKPVKEANIKKIKAASKTPVKYGEHYQMVNRKKSLKPNVEYVDGNNYKYATDAQGRISKVEGELKLQKGKRNPYAQRTVGGKDRLPTDDGGHLIGSQFNGSRDIDNLVAQSKYLNRAGGEWYKMETEWADALKAGKKVEVDIQPIYKGTSARPDAFSVRYKIGEVEQIRRMNNPTGP